MNRTVKFPPPLHVLVLLTVLIVSVVTLLFKAFVMDRIPYQRYVENQRTAARVQVERLSSLAMRADEDKGRTLRSYIGIMRSFPTLHWAAVCDAQGTVVACTNAAWEGKPFSEVAPADASELSVRAAALRGNVETLHGLDRMITALPAPAEEGAPPRYVAIAQRDLSAGAGQIQRSLRRNLMIMAGLLLAYSLISWLAVYLFVRWRLRDFYDRLGLGGGSATPAPLTGGDEFADISRVLGTAEHLLRDVADSLHEAVWILSPELRTVYLSPAFERIHLRSRQQEYDGTEMPDYILTEYHDLVRNAFTAVVMGAPSVEVEYRIRRGDGEIRWIEARGEAVRDASGKLVRIVGISRDITTQKVLQEELVNVSEQERNSLGHDLHDDACQRLAAMKLKSEALATRLKLEHSKHATLASELTNQLGGASALLRNIARGLAPVEVEEDGLMHALEKLVLRQEAIHEVPCFFAPEEPIHIGNRMVANHLYRIAQEFINNAARHAKPERIDLRIESAGSVIRLSVTNDGLPFIDPPAGHSGMGLKIVRHRASAMGAHISIRPRTDGLTGTEAVCSVPWDVCNMPSPQENGTRRGEPPAKGASTEAVIAVARR